MTFRVGQKVECVEAIDCGDGLVKGDIYTIASVRYFSDDDSVGVTVVEIDSKEDEEYYAEFPAWRFRPVVERTTDISIFTAMLNTSKRGVDA